MIDALGRPQTVLLLGAGSDIGQEIARRLVRGGTRTFVLAARAPASLGSFAEELRRNGAERAEVVVFDADATASHAGLVDDVVALVGDIDVAVLAWGVLGEQAELEDDPAAAAALAHTNYTGAVSIGTALGVRFREQGHGVIVALSSVAGERARRSNYVYGSSKAGFDAFFTGLGDRLAGTGARVLVVRPGFVHTKMTKGMPPAPLATTPEAVASAVAAALGTRREELWVPSPLRWVMAVLRHLPRPVFRRLRV